MTWTRPKTDIMKIKLVTEVHSYSIMKSPMVYKRCMVLYCHHYSVSIGQTYGMYKDKDVVWV